MISIKQRNPDESNSNKKSICPKWSKGQAYRMWKDGTISESYYTANYMDSEERAEYYRYKRQEEIENTKAKQKETAEQKKKEKADLDKLEKDIYTAVEKGLSAFFEKRH